MIAALDGSGVSKISLGKDAYRLFLLGWTENGSEVLMGAVPTPGFASSPLLAFNAVTGSVRTVPDNGENRHLVMPLPSSHGIRSVVAGNRFISLEAADTQELAGSRCHEAGFSADEQILIHATEIGQDPKATKMEIRRRDLVSRKGSDHV